MNIKFGADIYAPKEVNELARASIGYIESDVMDIKKRYVTLGFHLYEMDQCRYYEDLGYENLYECIEANFAMDKSAVSRCIGVWKAFAAVDGDGSRKMWVDDRYKDFSYSQLTEMLPMSERDRYRISSDMSVKKIREVKQRLKEKKSSENMKPVVEQEKDKISARGTRVNVREDDVVATSQQWGDVGASLGAKLDNMDLSLESLTDNLGGLNGFDASSIPTVDNLGDIGKVGKVGKIEDDVKLSDEDIKIYRDLAERRYMNNIELQTMAPQIHVSIPSGSARS